MLQKKYQPQLRDGIKIAVDLVNSVKQDKKDGDVDIKVRIAPNDTFKVIAINFIETTDEDELAKITPDDRFFLEGVQDKVDTILIQNTKEVEGKNNASKAIFDTIQTEVQILVDEYKLDLKYGDISMKLLGGGDDRRLNFTRTYTKDQKEIIVNLGHVKVDLKKSIKNKEDKEAKGKLIPKMQPYREDVWTKGPHLDIVRADNNSLKITEALLDIRSGRLIWIRFGDMGGATSSDLKAADRVIKGLLKNTSIMTEAKGQAFQALEEMKAAINSNRTSKKKLQQAQRGKEKFTKMLKLL